MKKRFRTIRVGKVGSLVALLFCLSGCPDLSYYAFVNGLPVPRRKVEKPAFRVYLAIDGLSYYSVFQAKKRGAFTGPEWTLSKFISIFPSMSDPGWTRILHTEKLEGYEYEYYNPKKDSLVNSGIMGLFPHVLPTLSRSLDVVERFLRVFDYRSNGYFHRFHAYSDPYLSLSESFDNFFYVLGGRIRTSSIFSAYFLEFDALGHLEAEEGVIQALIDLFQRIEKFKQQHPHRKILFTFFSDHGMDFTAGTRGGQLIEFPQEMQKVGIQPVRQIGSSDPLKEIFAIPITHTRVTYMALHTHPKLIEEVARRTSLIPSVDVSLCKLKRKEFLPRLSNPSEELEWYGLWANGTLSLPFGFNPRKNEYYLPQEGHYKHYGLQLNFEKAQPFIIKSGPELFELTKNTPYPDLFFRARTSLVPTGVKYPADVLVSFKPGFVSLGVSLPGKDDLVQNSHGSLLHGGSLGTLLTEEKKVPEAVRSEQFMELFPKMKEQVLQRMKWVDGDPFENF